MNILILGGTRYFGVNMIEILLNQGHTITIATRGLTPDDFGERIERVVVERLSRESMKQAFDGKFYDVIYDKIGYSSEDVSSILDFAKCNKYIFMSTAGIYDVKHICIREHEFNACETPYVMCKRGEFVYSFVKQQAERILEQKYSHVNHTAVRYPVVLGPNDYTKRLLFYVNSVKNGTPMYIDNIDAELCYISQYDAAQFLAYLADNDSPCAINGASNGTVSLRKLISYIEKKCGKTAIIDLDGEPAPFNGETDYSLDTSKANQIGYTFENIDDWIYGLIDFYLQSEPIIRL